MKRILVPCDFSPAAQEAFRFAVQIAQQGESELHVLYVIDITFLNGNPSLSSSYAFNLAFLNDMEKEASQKFQEMWERYAPMTMAVKFRHIVGSLLNETKSYIREINIDVVVMGTHGSVGTNVGTNAARIVRHSSVPVIAVRQCPSTAIENIVVPVNLFNHEAGFLPRLKTLQDFFHAKIHLLYVNTPLFFRTDTDIRSDMDDFVRKHSLHNYTLNFRADHTAEDGIASFIKENPMDMIAMGTHGWKGLWHFLIGSTAEDVVKHLKIPVWVAPVYANP